MSNTLVPIKTTTLTETTSSVTFSGIPQGYTDLKIVMSVRTNLDETPGVIYFNSDTTNTNYNVRRIIGEGSGSTSSATANYPYMYYMNTSARTAGMFSAHEIYVHNYTSSSAKKMSSEGVTENNGTYVVLAEVFGTWSGTNPITSVTLKPYNEGAASFVAGSTFTIYGISNGVKATGGTLTVAGGYAYHTFTSTGSFLPTQRIKNAEVLCIAGGGGAANNIGGGGGAGGVRYVSNLIFNAGNSITALVGSGGSGYYASGGVQGLGAKGSNSTFLSVSSTGGGYGANGDYPGGDGGSGGGTRNYAANGGSGNQGNYTPVEGYAGANGNPSTTAGGGGGAGGAGAAGVSGQSGSGGSGTNAYSSWGAITGTGVAINGVYYYAGGGGGGGYSVTPVYAGAGGYGGGGAGTDVTNGNGTSGTANTGGGGGGAGAVTSGPQTAGSGGSGIIIVRYPL